MKCNKRIKQKGLTLIELAITIAILSIAFLGILSIFKFSVNYSTDPIVIKQTILISESIMEEIMSKPFNKPEDGFSGPYNSSNRHKFDAVLDYKGLEINGMTTANGVSIPDLEKYKVKISIENKQLGDIALENSLLITVNVDAPNSNFVLKGYKINEE
jgi:MSHA pilin protein MshD